MEGRRRERYVGSCCWMVVSDVFVDGEWDWSLRKAASLVKTVLNSVIVFI
jgi:hypothetical protein